MEKTIEISEEPKFIEAWHEGSVTYEAQEYKFWLVNPVRLSSNEHDYEPEVRWFFKSVPREVRNMYNQIIEQFKTKNYDRGKTESTERKASL